MYQDLLQQFIPNEPRSIALAVAIGGSVFGAMLWLLGVKMSRPTVTLFAVIIGAALGRQFPRWFDWNIAGAGPAVCGAVVLGVSGFVLHRLWIGIGLGLTVAVWTASGVWLARHGVVQWTWPAMDQADTVWSYLKTVWANVPPPVATAMPYACGGAMGASLAFTILWPRLATALCWSIIGLSMLVTMGIGALDMSGRPWADHLPQQTWAQLATLGVMLVLGTLIQWHIQPKRAAASASRESEPSDKSDADDSKA